MAIIRCPHCGTANREGSNFCNSCGVELYAAANTGERAAPQDKGTQTGAASHPDTTSPQDAASQQDAAPQETGATDQPPSSERPSTHTPLRQDDETGGRSSEPWLNLDFLAEDDAPPFEREEEEETPYSELARLLSSVSGLLAPVRITVSGDASDARPQPYDEPADGQADLWRRVRTHMASPPLLAGLSLPGPDASLPNLQLRWVFLLLALAIAVPAIADFAWPSGSATQWPGVQEAFDTVDSLPANASVLVYWAYDPSTAGELDLEALAVTTHLFEKRARITAISLLPGGPATARRLINRARLEWQRSENLAVTAKSTWTIPIIYLPGGSSILALIAQDPASALIGMEPDTLPPDTNAFAATPDLAVVFGAQADDVQHWLEQVQPLNGAPVVAVVAAGADPVVRPYLDSGQLAGLVSGFDGAYSYRELLDEQDRSSSARQLNMQLVLQDWGHFVFFLLIVFGNFAAVIRRSEEKRPA